MQASQTGQDGTGHKSWMSCRSPDQTLKHDAIGIKLNGPCTTAGFWMIFSSEMRPGAADLSTMSEEVRVANFKQDRPVALVKLRKWLGISGIT